MLQSEKRAEPCHSIEKLMQGQALVLESRELQAKAHVRKELWGSPLSHVAMWAVLEIMFLEHEGSNTGLVFFAKSSPAV